MGSPGVNLFIACCLQDMPADTGPTFHTLALTTVTAVTALTDICPRDLFLKT